MQLRNRADLTTYAGRKSFLTREILNALLAGYGSTSALYVGVGALNRLLGVPVRYSKQASGEILYTVGGVGHFINEKHTINL